MAVKHLVVEGKSFELSYELINPTKTKDISVFTWMGFKQRCYENSIFPLSKRFLDILYLGVDTPGFGKTSKLLYFNY